MTGTERKEGREQRSRVSLRNREKGFPQVVPSLTAMVSSNSRLHESLHPFSD